MVYVKLRTKLRFLEEICKRLAKYQQKKGRLFPNDLLYKV
ncbi:hypothetical protein HMPREF1870_01892 [Bacteroidales bacterium KA00344]|nr:hypothetical protein HMPREF1870_01892 [Bacteroidales bacterium KA00344]